MNERHALRGERLDLVPATPDHAEITWPYLQQESMWEFFPALRPPTIDALRARYERWTSETPYVGAVERWENWICTEREAQTAIGEAQATYAGTNVYVAYGIFPPFRGRGYAREAVTTMIEHARAVHGARRAIAEIAAANSASLRVAQSLGFDRVTTQLRDDGLGYAGRMHVYRRLLA
jgi:RimJ/RimL family protein N-acetyltransferase